VLRPAAAWKIAGLAALVMLAGQVVAYELNALDIVAAAIGEAAAGVLVLWLVRPWALAGVVKPAWPFVIAAVLVGISAWYVDIRIVTALQPPGEIETLETVVEKSPLVPTLIAVALLPAITEELMFRGLIARSLARRSQITAVVVSGLVFSLWHLNPPQIIGTLPLGLVLGTLAVRSDSVIPGAITHLLNNAIAILLSRGHLESLSSWIDAHEPAALSSAVFLSLGGVGIAVFARAA
jgi:membrane protease YdiL (CAAX protease family)